MSKNCFYLAKITKNIPLPSNVGVFGSHFIEISEETEHYIEYKIRWFDECKIGKEVMAGQFHDITYWKLKEHPQLYVVFVGYPSALQFFYQKFYEFEHIALQNMAFHFKKDIHASAIHKTITINEEGEPQEQYYKKNQSTAHLWYDTPNLFSVAYPIEFGERKQYLELFIDGQVKFGIEKKNAVVYDIVRYVLLFRKVENK